MTSTESPAEISTEPRPEPNPLPARLFYHAVSLLLIAIAAYSAFLPFIRHKGVDDVDWGAGSYMNMVEGTAWKPFVTRALLPWTVKQLSRGITPEFRQSVDEFFYGSEELTAIVFRHRYNREHLAEIAIGLVLIYACFVGFGLSLRYLFREIYEAPFWVGDLVAIAGLVCVPAMYQYGNYIYDIPLLFLFTLGLALMARGQWIAYAIVFALGCVNKETTILLTWIFLIHYRDGRRMDWLQFRTLAFLQIALWIAIRAAIQFHFRENMGGHLKIRIEHNLWALENIKWSAAPVVGIVIASVFAYWGKKPLFLKHALTIMIPLLVLTWFFGWIEETRDYYEAYPVVVVLCAGTVGTLLARWKKRSSRPAAAPM